MQRLFRFFFVILRLLRFHHLFANILASLLEHFLVGKGLLDDEKN